MPLKLELLLLCFGKAEATRGMFIRVLLFLACFAECLTHLMALCQRIKGLHFAAFVDPVALPGGSLLFRAVQHAAGLVDGLIQTTQKMLIVAPCIRSQPLARLSKKAALIFVAVLHQQLESLLRFLFAGNQFAQLAGGLIQSKIGEIQQRLKVKRFAHGRSIPARSSAQLREQPGQVSDAFRSAGAFFNALLQKLFQLRVELDGAIQQRVRTRHIGADGE